jgi:hypothetical protein
MMNASQLSNMMQISKRKSLTKKNTRFKKVSLGKVNIFVFLVDFGKI